MERLHYFVIESLKHNDSAQERLMRGSAELLIEFDNGKRHHLAILRRIDR